MSTKVSELVDLDVDMAAEVPCDWERTNPGCPRVAAWTEIVLCPRHHEIPVCDEHKAETDRQVDRFVRNNGRDALLVCLACDADDADIAYPYFDWRPL